MATSTTAIDTRGDNFHWRRHGQVKTKFRCPECGIILRNVLWTRVPLRFFGKKGRVVNGRCVRCDPTVATEEMLSSFAVRSLERFVQSWGIEIEMETEHLEEEEKELDMPLRPRRGTGRLERELFGSYQHHYLKKQQIDGSNRSDTAATIGGTYMTHSQRLYLEEIQKFWYSEAGVDVTFQIVTIKGRFQVKAHQCIVAARCPALLKFLICQRQQDENNAGGGRHKIVDLSNTTIGKYPQLLRSVIELCYGGVYDYDQNLLKEQEGIIEDYLGKEYVPVAHMKQIQRDMSYLIEFVDADFAVGGVQPDVVIYGKRRLGNNSILTQNTADNNNDKNGEWILYAHSAILCAHSEYFRLRLMYGWPVNDDSSAGSDSDSGMRVIRLDSAQFTKEIMEQILQACYTLRFDMHLNSNNGNDEIVENKSCPDIKIPNIHDAFSDFDSSKSGISSSGAGSGSVSNSKKRENSHNSNDSDNIDLQTVFRVYEGADYLRIGCVCLYCEEILASVLSGQNLIEIWEFAEYFCATNVTKECEKFLCENFIKIQKQHSSVTRQATSDGVTSMDSTFSRLNVSQLKNMLLSSSEDYVVEGTEQEILNAILQWLSLQHQRQHKEEVLKLVRFPLVPMESAEMLEVKKRNLITEDQMQTCHKFQTDDDFCSNMVENMIRKMAQRDDEEEPNNNCVMIFKGNDDDDVDNEFNGFRLKHYQLRRNQSNMSYISQRLMNNGDQSIENGRQQRRHSRFRQFLTSLASM